MSGPFKRRPSLKTLPALGLNDADMRRRRSSLPGMPSTKALLHNQHQQQEVPWDLVDRCLLPVVFCHAAAVILSTVLNTLHISSVTTLTLFIWLTISTIAAVLFYHNLKVSAAGKAVLLTGCHRRTGYHLARHLDELGFTVFAGFPNAADNTYASALQEVCSARMHVIQLDVGIETQLLAASLYIVEHLPVQQSGGSGALWAVVHCDGGWGPVGEVEWLSQECLKKATAQTLLGPTRLTQLLLPLLRHSHGRLVFTSTALCRQAAATRSAPGRGAHRALLAARETLAAWQRRELRARGVAVVVVATGEGEMREEEEDERREEARKMWCVMGDEQKATYGEEYFETVVRGGDACGKVNTDQETAMVLRALTDSITRTFPLPKYTPVSRKEKLQTFVADYFPRSVYDIIYT